MTYCISSFGYKNSQAKRFVCINKFDCEFLIDMCIYCKYVTILSRIKWLKKVVLRNCCHGCSYWAGAGSVVLAQLLGLVCLTTGTVSVGVRRFSWKGMLLHAWSIYSTIGDQCGVGILVHNLPALPEFSFNCAEWLCVETVSSGGDAKQQKQQRQVKTTLVFEQLPGY